VKLTRWQVAELPKLLCFRQPWHERPEWTWQDKGVLREVQRLLRLGYAAEAVSHETIPDLAKKAARAKAYRSGAKKAARTKKLQATARTQPEAVESERHAA
jgi:hypothetical protein